MPTDTKIPGFDWLAPRRILFGAGRFAEVGALAAGLGQQVCLVTGGRSLRESGRLDALAAQFDREGLQWTTLAIEREPTVELIDAMAGEASDFHPHVIVAVGGGSALDAGKAVAALLANGGRALDYLEGVGLGRALTAPAVPVIAVPTTAGTGAEATKNAVIGDDARTFKKSMRSDGMLPAVAVVDPELTRDCPSPVTAACGMDTLTQLLEAYTSRRAHAVSDALAREGLTLAAALPRIMNADEPAPLREAMSLASLLGGICLANVGLGAVHGLVSPLGAHHPVPHGAGCAALLPAVVQANARRARADGNDVLLQKYRYALDALTDKRAASDDPYWHAMLLADALHDMNAQMGLPGLAAYGVTRADIPRLVAGGRGNSMRSNPVDLTDSDLTAILEASL